MRCVCCAQSTGEYLCLLDADDTMMPTRVEKQVYVVGRTCEQV